MGSLTGCGQEKQRRVRVPPARRLLAASWGSAARAAFGLFRVAPVVSSLGAWRRCVHKTQEVCVDELSVNPGGSRQCLCGAPNRIPTAVLSCHCAASWDLAAGEGIFQDPVEGSYIGECWLGQHRLFGWFSEHQCRCDTSDFWSCTTPSSKWRLF